MVQMLYSYLLTRNDFQVATAPSRDTRDGKYALSLYHDLLLMILELSGYNVKGPGASSPMDTLKYSNMLSENKLAKALSADLAVRDLIARGSATIADFDPALIRLYGQVTQSAVFTDFKKKRKTEMADEARFWSVVLNTIVAREPLVLEAARRNPDFTSAGFREGVEMAVRTIEEFVDVRGSLASAAKSLEESLRKAYDLYHAMLYLPVAVTDYERERLEAAKEKYCPSPEDLNPNMRFVDNRYVEAIRENPDMVAYLKKHPVGWEEDFYLVKDLMDKIRASEVYQSYMEADEPGTLAADCDLWRQLLKSVVFPSDALAETLEAKSVYWNDDLAIMGTFTLKTIKQMGARGNRDMELLPFFKDDDDKRFGPDLFMYAVKGRDEFRGYIDRFVNGSQWDPERLAFMDIVVLLAAIAELVHYPSIPVPVTINEYVEIANYYSSPRSGQFVNGMLFSITNYLKETGVINK